MAAHVPLREKVAGAMPFPVLIAYDVVTVFASKFSTELLQFDAVWLFCVALSFLDLPNEAGLHFIYLS
jgi:hypothetical protein